MPIYDYRCGACGREIEVMHGIHESGPSTCEACGGTMRKALSPPAIHFKGSGWAKKDAATAAKSSRPATSAAAGPEKPSSSEPGSGTASGSKGESTSGSPTSAGPKAD